MKNSSSVLSPYSQLAIKNDGIIDFYITTEDSTKWIVSIHTEAGLRKIGYVHVEFEGENFRYISTNLKGKEIAQPTTDFNYVELFFERYARLLELQGIRKGRNQNKILSYNINLKNSNTMKNQTQNTVQKAPRQNQLRFIEYEKPLGDGHFMTVADSYHNVLGRVHKSYNPETKKYEYVAFDHAGNLLSKSERLWEVKNEFIKNREQLLEQAHQRRIEAKGKSKEELDQREHPDKATGRKAEMEKLRGGQRDISKEASKEKEGVGSELVNDELVQNPDREDDDENENLSQEEAREQELDDLRNGRDDQDMDIEY